MSAVEILRPQDKGFKPKRQTHTEFPKRVFNHKSGKSMVVSSSEEMEGLHPDWRESKKDAPGPTKEKEILPKTDAAAEAAGPSAEAPKAPAAPEAESAKKAKGGGKKKAGKKAPAAPAK